MPVLSNNVNETWGPGGKDAGPPIASQPVVLDVTPQANTATILQQAATALTNNLAYLAIVGPTNAQVVAQVRALTQQVDKLIRLAANLLDDVT